MPVHYSVTLAPTKIEGDRTVFPKDRGEFFIVVKRPPLLEYATCTRSATVAGCVEFPLGTYSTPSFIVPIDTEQQLVSLYVSAETGTDMGSVIGSISVDLSRLVNADAREELVDQGRRVDLMVWGVRATVQFQVTMKLVTGSRVAAAGATAAGRKPAGRVTFQDATPAASGASRGASTTTTARPGTQRGSSRDLEALRAMVAQRKSALASLRTSRVDALNELRSLRGSTVSTDALGRLEMRLKQSEALMASVANESGTPDRAALKELVKVMMSASATQRASGPPPSTAFHHDDDNEAVTWDEPPAGSMAGPAHDHDEDEENLREFTVQFSEAKKLLETLQKQRVPESQYDRHMQRVLEQMETVSSLETVVADMTKVVASKRQTTRGGGGSRSTAPSSASSPKRPPASMSPEARLVWLMCCDRATTMGHGGLEAIGAGKLGPAPPDAPRQAAQLRELLGMPSIEAAVQQMVTEYKTVITGKAAGSAASKPAFDPFSDPAAAAATGAATAPASSRPNRAVNVDDLFAF